ncbi:hypothetical protein F4778DRAFT_85719 [Xylariomycetidae sp. FL2044]|nr:hypothetical protein F4778DRAFT_85719 [Xylariomycetidae sp. FL2044]
MALNAPPPRRPQLNTVQTAIHYFTENVGYKFARRLGSGFNGATLLFEELGNGDYVWRKVVVKYLLGQRSPNLLRRERNMVEMMTGAEHIVQIVPPGLVEIGRVPDLLMESAGDMSMGDMAKRFREKQTPVPNRMLWYILLCLVRATIGFRYPPRGQHGEVRREALPAPGDPLPPERIHFKDFNPGNLMVSYPFGPQDEEHQLGPLVKVIDFGSAILLESIEDEARDFDDNFRGIGWAMATLIIEATLQETVTPDMFEEREVTIDLPEYNGPDTFETRAPVELDEIELDPELLMIIKLLLSTKDQPPLEVLLRIVEDRARNRSEIDYARLGYPFASLETDAGVREILQDVLVNGDFREEDVQRAAAVNALREIQEVVRQQRAV